MKRLASFLSVALVAVFAMVSVVPASAAPSSTRSSSGLSIIPRINLQINPGQTVTSKLVIGNLSNTTDLNLTLRPIDFTFSNDSGVPKLFLAQNAPQTTWSIKPFINIPGGIVVPKGQTKTVPFTLSVPKGQGAGSYYSAIEYESGNSNGGSVSLSATGVSLVFVEVPGIVHEDVSLQKMGAYQTANQGVTGGYAFINTIMPRNVAFSLKNNGNVAESPSGTLTIHDMWGNKVANITNVNPSQDLALIGQTRLFLNCIKSQPTSVTLGGSTTHSQTCTNPHLWPGMYTMTLDSFYGQNGNQTKELTATATFWYMPWWAIVVLLLIVLLIVGAILRIRYKIRKHRSTPHVQRARTFRLGRK